MKYPRISPARRHERLAYPSGKVRVVLDTDTFNEVDDQFAIVTSPNQVFGDLFNKLGARAKAEES